MQLAILERDADALLAALTRARYLEASGRHPYLPLTTIFDRFPHVPSLVTYEQLLDVPADVRVTAALRTLVLEQYAGAAVAGRDERIVTAERAATVEWRGDALPLRTACQRAALEPVRALRHELDELIRDAARPLTHLRLDRVLAVRAALAEVGQYDLPTDDLGFWAHVRGVNLDEVGRLATHLLEVTSGLYADALRDQLVHHRLDDGDAWEADLEWILRGQEYDAVYPDQRLMPTAVRALADLGIRLQDQTSVQLDLEPLPERITRSFCAPIGVPDEVVVVLAPTGGIAAYLGLLRGLGEAERHAHVDRTQPLAYRRLGDGAVVEGYGLLLSRLAGRADWLIQRLEAEQTRDAVRLAAFERLYRLRRAAATHLYEVAIRSAEEPDALAGEYVDRFAEALGVRPFEERFLDGLDDPFAAARHLRAALFACQLGLFLEREFDEEWYRSPRAGRFLIDRWREGQRYTAEELVRHLGFDGLDPTPLLDEIRADLVG